MVGKNLLFFGIVLKEVLKEVLKGALKELFFLSPSSRSIKLSELYILVLFVFDKKEKR